MMRSPPASSPAVAKRLRAIPGRDTAIERMVRARLREVGIAGYRIDARPLPTLNRRADIVFRRQRVAVFLDGCYWHGCPRHFAAPAVNADYWAPKIAGNQRRDADTVDRLHEAGWVAIRAWGHEVSQDGGATVANRINRIVRSRQPGDQKCQETRKS